MSFYLSILCNARGILLVYALRLFFNIQRSVTGFDVERLINLANIIISLQVIFGDKKFMS